MSDRASKALAEAGLPGEPRTYDAISKRSEVPPSTLYHRDHGRPLERLLLYHLTSTALKCRLV
jgi:hypothetical protein